MVGTDYTPNKQEPAGHSRDLEDKILKLPLSMDEDSNTPEALPDSDQIVKIDFSTIKDSADLPATENIEFLNLENAVLSETQEEKPAPVAEIPSSPAPAVPPLFAGSQILETIEDLGSAMQENHRQLGWIKAEMSKYSTILPKIDSLQKQVEHSNRLESINQKLFNTMHEELKSYKDSFLFDSLQKPMIRDLLVLFDDLCGQARRMARFISEHPVPPENEETRMSDAELRSARENINNTVHFLIEILQRMDVCMEEGNHEKLDLKLHKVVGVEPTESPEEQNSIARVVRPGFLWRNRVLRPTEVIIRKIPQPIRKSGKK